MFGVKRSGIEPRPPAPRAHSLTIMLRGRSLMWSDRHGPTGGERSRRLK